MKQLKFTLPFVFAFIGFFICYYIYGNIIGIDISLKTIILGTNTGISIIDYIGDSVLSNARNRIWLGTLIFAVIGFAIGFWLNFKLNKS